jgi:hypothetical protein
VFDGYQNWRTNSDINGLEYEDLNKRLTRSDHLVTGQPWRDLRLSLEESKFNLVERFLNIDTEKRWPNFPEQISKHIVMYLSLVADLPGYKMNTHIDNRTVYAAGYVNVFDNDPVTVISTQRSSMFSLNKTAEYRAPGAKGTGVFWLNTEASWHWVNRVVHDRRIIMISFHIVPWG